MLICIIQEYYTSRATSSIPAALIAHVPLVTSREFLNIYPCLRDAPIHRKIAWGDGSPNAPEESKNSTIANGSESSECSAMNVAVKLSEEEYSTAKKEIEYCSAVLWKQAKVSFHLAAARNIKFKNRGPHSHEGHKQREAQGISSY